MKAICFCKTSVFAFVHTALLRRDLQRQVHRLEGLGSTLGGGGGVSNCSCVLPFASLNTKQDNFNGVVSDVPRSFRLHFEGAQYFYRYRLQVNLSVVSYVRELYTVCVVSNRASNGSKYLFRKIRKIRRKFAE